ncbi:NusG domain II-containing protein [Saccharibacillus sp. CPCC 101409]|uniref:NusG domain II-containing protein n=1 Tax=Saccharibacillus sp. CPCC 101409 TaxID=3058041 RepID=UPI002672773B|nr:NusG domain II-containing protein [Saccharibacillus sp. CPCC 101409]MDO3411427.1 NusG domain II-containing protein [Saccharibacillus sp. CPCC 101409]
MKKGDLILIGIVVIVALAFIVPRWFSDNSSEKNHNENRIVYIEVDGKPYKELPLTEEEQLFTITTDKGFNQIKIHNNGVEMIDADCPDKLCLGFGFVTRPGQQIVCLPHRVSVFIGVDSGEENEIDDVVG